MVTIDSLVTSGEGSTEAPDGGRWLVPRTLPGERVRVRPPEKGRRARLLTVLEPAAERVVPPCPVVDQCGGCDWMHLDLAAQRAAHRQLVADVLARHQLAPSGPIAVEQPTGGARYRSRARLLIKAAGGQVHVGYRAARSHAVTEVSDCHVLAAELVPMFDELRAVLAGSRGDGDAQIALGRAGLPVLTLRFRGELAGSAFGAVNERVAEGRWAGAALWPDGASEPATFGDHRAQVEGVDGAPLVLGGFGQASDAGARALSLHVRELAAESPREHVVELFAGSGTLSVGIARHAERFTAVESDAESASALRENLAARSLTGKVVTADAEAWTLPGNASTVVLDPPRSGAPGATAAILAQRPRRVIYVACDPASFARDAAELRARYRLGELRLFELFPHTHHVELVAVFDKGT